MKISFWVPGTPITSNLVHGRHGNYWREDKRGKGFSSGRRTRWKDAIATVAAMNMLGVLPVDEPVKVTLVFRVRKPQRTTWEKPGRIPDLEKLERAPLDAISLIVYADDARICDKITRKVYVKPGEDEGVEITVETYEREN